MSYMTNLAKELTNINFNILENLCTSQNITDLTKIMTFSKRQGSILYTVSVINCDAEKDYEKYENIISNTLKSINVKKIHITVFLTSCIDDKLIDYCKYDVKDYNSNLINVRWILDINNKNIVVNGEQPDEILNIRQALIAGCTESSEHIVSANDLINQSESNQINLIKCVKPYLTYLLFAINAVFWIIMYTEIGEAIIDKMALNKFLVTDGQIYRLFTYMFTHGGFEHILCNNFSLIIIGSRVERYTGHLKFIIIYLLSGIIAGCTSYFVDPYGIAVGASGAIFGITGLLIYLTYKLKNNIGGFDVYLAIIYAIIGTSSGFLIANVDNYAHIGGLIGGILLSFIFRAEK